MKVAILGCGPAGLIAAQAASEFGAEITILSQPPIQKSPIYGAQFLYEPVPGITRSMPDGMLHNIFLGDVEVYRKKIYGDPTIKSTWDNKSQTIEPVWSLHHTYSMLWDRFKRFIVQRKVTSNVLESVQENCDFVFSSIPLPHICRNKTEHQFKKYQVRIVRQGNQTRLFPGESNICIYNGLREDTWFRFSHMFGVNGGFEMPLWNNSEGSVIVNKPTGTTCDCFSNVARVGRYGTWDYGVNTHHSWGIVMEVIRDRIKPRPITREVQKIPNLSFPQSER